METVGAALMTSRHAQNMRRYGSLTPEGPLSPRESRKHVEKTGPPYMNSTSKSEIFADTYEHSPREFNSDRLRKSSGSRDRVVGGDYESERIGDLEETVDRLKSAVISLTEENLRLNKKIRGYQSDCSPSLTNHNALNSASTSSHETGHSPTSKLEVSLNSTTYQDREKQDKVAKQRQTEARREEDCESPEQRCFLLVNEKLELERKLRKTEDYCKECAHELKRLLQKYENLKALNKTMKKQCEKLAMENRRLTGALEVERAGARAREEGDGGLRAQLEAAKVRCARLSGERGQLEGRAATLAGEVRRLADELALSMGEVRRLGVRRGSAARLRENNEALTAELVSGAQRLKEAEADAARLREERGLLESCLRTLQSEKDLLQLEVWRVHQEYIELSDGVSLQLREISPLSTEAVAGSHQMADWTSDAGAGQQGPSRPLHSSPVARETPDGPVDGEAIDQIRKRFDEDERRRAQRYQNIISQSE